MSDDKRPTEIAVDADSLEASIYHPDVPKLGTAWGKGKRVVTLEAREAGSRYIVRIITEDGPTPPST